MNAIREAKREIVEQIKEKVQKCASFVVIDYKGLTVEEDTAFRTEFRKAGVEYKVLKNTLVRIALNELGYHQFDEALNGPTSVAFSFDDVVLPAKIAADHVKKFNKMEIKCGMVEKEFANAAAMKALANIPGKQTLLSMLCNVLQAPIRSLAIAVNAIAEKQAQ